jgi:hypothetical protein
MIQRELAAELAQAAQQLPVIGILGPRQSGKTTLAREVFKSHTYVSLENVTERMLAERDPQAFMQRYVTNDAGVIIDEFHYVPQLLSYVQLFVDEKKVKGYFILTGSQNFLASQAISQSLAGRIGIFTLLPLTIKELQRAEQLPEQVDELLLQGSYPRIYAEKVSPQLHYASYVFTYLEKDVRQLVQIKDMSTFRRFLQLCAARIGQAINISALAVDCGITQTTAKAWLSVLEASYIIFLLSPYYKNYTKRLVKTPKLYFYDTGLACSLLGLESPAMLQTSYLKGALFECLVVSELCKRYYNKGRSPRLYFWRDNHGHEVDVIVDKGGEPVPIEIKASSTYSKSFLSGVDTFLALAESKEAYLVYSGEQELRSLRGCVLNWRHIDEIQL